jgi:flagellar biosynthesis protein FlhB
MEEERTEKATPKRRTEARKKGQVAKSREIPSVTVLLGGILVLFLTSSYAYQHLALTMVRYLRQSTQLTLDSANLQTLSFDIFQVLMVTLGPIMIGVMVISLITQYAQVGFLFSTESLAPNFSRLFSWRRLFSMQAIMELVKSLAKIAIVGGVAYYTLSQELSNIVPLMDQEVQSIFQYICSVSFRLCLKTVMVMLVLAALDYLYQRWTYEKGLRMSRQDLKEEGKQTEGDPLIKARIRSIQRELARKRMMAEVPKADVVITNPTHLAVALYYNHNELAAPKVVAKGAGFVAEKIKELGRNHQIPVVENKPLAQILFKTVEVGEMIPAHLYQLVADILAFVYRLKHKTL